MDKVKSIIFDTDLGGDCDDVMALDLLLSADRNGECRLLGVTYSADAAAAVPCIHAILRQHGRAGLPIGRPAADPVDGSESDCYASVVAERFSYDGAPDYENAPAAASLMRRLISEAERKVVIVATGFLTNLAALLRSGPDEYSPLGGLELVREKVSEIAVMAGNFSHINCIAPAKVGEDNEIEAVGEWNVLCDIEAARYFFENCPVPVVVLPFEAGIDMITGAPMASHGGRELPDSLSFIAHGSEKGRHSWDPATALYAVYGAKPWFYLSSPGRVTVRADGVTDFTPTSDGQCRILECALPKSGIAEKIDELVMRLF